MRFDTNHAGLKHSIMSVNCLCLIKSKDADQLCIYDTPIRFSLDVAHDKKSR